MDNTKKKILDAATDIFINKGFAGTSISDIAKLAGINQSLIYHHIGNKQALWKEVKKSLIGNLVNSELVSHKSFANFVSDIITQRIAMYEKEPRLLRLIQWQMLEEEDDLKSESSATPLSWIDCINAFQDVGEIKLDYPASLIALYIHSLINGLLFDTFNIFTSDPGKKGDYVNMIIKEIVKTFTLKG